MDSQRICSWFLALEDNTEFLYKATNYYNPSAERSIRWDDDALAIKWPSVKNLIVSDKDLSAPGLFGLNGGEKCR